MSEVVQEPLPLKPGILAQKKSVVLVVKRKNEFTKTIPWAENPGKTRREERFSKSIFAFFFSKTTNFFY